MLVDIRVNLVHYRTFEEGLKKWEERKRRINWNNLFIVGTERWDCNYETIKSFEQLPYNKVFFTHYKNQFLLRRYLDDFDYVSF